MPRRAHDVAPRNEDALAHGLDRLSDVLDDVRAALDEVTDAAARMTAQSRLIVDLEAHIDRLSRDRLGEIAGLREEGWSYQRIAMRSGLSKSRVAQLSRAAEERSG